MKPVSDFIVSRVETRRFEVVGQLALKPVSHFIGLKGLKPGALKLCVNWL
jgi:hypothetical protein